MKGNLILPCQLVFSWRDLCDITALVTQVNKCTEVNWTVNFFNITGNGKMIKNGPHLLKFSDLFYQSVLNSKEIHFLLSHHD